MSEVPTQGVFEFVTPGEDIILHRGEGVVDGAAGQVQIWVATGRIFGPRWRLEAGSRDVRLDSSTLSIEYPPLGEIDVSIAVRGTRSGTEGPVAQGSIGSSHLGGAAKLDRVVVHWMNLPVILPSSGLRVGDTSWSGRWHFEAAGWSFKLDSRPDLSEVLRTAHDQEQGFVMTHVGEIRRSDGQPFEATDVTEAIFAWQLTLSFALGRWVAPAIPAVGGGHGTPIVPHGTVAILSVGAARVRPVVYDDDLAIAPVMPLSLSYDHRVIDGAMGRRFMALVLENLEEPALFLAG